MQRFLIYLCLFIACQPDRKVTTPSLSEHDTTTSPAPDRGSAIQMEEDTSGGLTSNAPLHLPISQYRPPHLLFAGSFHGDEVMEDVEALSWLGLFPNAEGDPVLTRIKVLATRVVDELMDDPETGEKSGWEITTENGEYPLMLLSGGNFTEGKVEAIDMTMTLYPGDSARFEFKGATYLLFATGTHLFDSLSQLHQVSGYNLFVTCYRDGKIRSSLLASHPTFDDAMTSVLWSGDLDRDGHLDFLIDMSSHYNQRLPTLFLSGPVGDEVVISVAKHSSIGC